MNDEANFEARKQDEVIAEIQPDHRAKRNTAARSRGKVAVTEILADMNKTPVLTYQ